MGANSVGISVIPPSKFCFVPFSYFSTPLITVTQIFDVMILLQLLSVQALACAGARTPRHVHPQQARLP